MRRPHAFAEHGPHAVRRFAVSDGGRHHLSGALMPTPYRGDRPSSEVARTETGAMGSSLRGRVNELDQNPWRSDEGEGPSCAASCAQVDCIVAGAMLIGHVRSVCTPSDRVPQELRVLLDNELAAPVLRSPSAPDRAGLSFKECGAATNCP